MIKAKLFSYRDSNIYYKRYGISPDRHFDKLREKYGTSAAVKIVDRNMMKAVEDKYKEEQRILDMECPFR